MASASDPHCSEVWGHTSSRRRKGTVSYVLIRSWPTPAPLGTRLRSAAPPALGSQSPYSGEEAGPPTPRGSPRRLSMPCVGHRPCPDVFQPRAGFLSPSASLCFTQENGRKLCSLIDVQEDVVPAREIHPSQPGLRGNPFHSRVDGSRHSAKAPGWSLICEIQRGKHLARGWHTASSQDVERIRIFAVFYSGLDEGSFFFCLFFFGLSKDQGGLSKVAQW